MTFLPLLVGSLLVSWVYSASSDCGGTLSNTDRTTVTNIHNTYRSQLGKGQTAMKSGGNAPQGKNIYRLEYDCEVEAHAQQWANTCPSGHSSDSNLGENIYWSSGSGTAGKYSGTQTLWGDKDVLEKTLISHRNHWIKMVSWSYMSVRGP